MTNVVPFGKYKGQPVEAMAADHQYMEWLTSQPWFRERHQNIYTLIVNNFHEPSETPEHNKLQARFLDRDFVRSFFEKVYMPIAKSGDAFGNDAQFETLGFDVAVSMKYLNGDKLCALIEIKPVLSDDYPAVLRQMKASLIGLSNIRLRQLEESRFSDMRINCDYFGPFRVLYIGEYTGIGATLDDVRKIFAADHIKIVTSRQVECE